MDGGMAAGGLSSTDKGREETIGGIGREFFTRRAATVAKSSGGEPHVNLERFETMLREAKVRVVKARRLKSLARDGARITRITMKDGESYACKVFIDATYEGDLMARGGVSYIIGRETRADVRRKARGLPAGKGAQLHHASDDTRLSVRRR